MQASGSRLERKKAGAGLASVNRPSVSRVCLIKALKSGSVPAVRPGLYRLMVLTKASRAFLVPRLLPVVALRRARATTTPPFLLTLYSMAL